MAESGEAMIEKFLLAKLQIRLDTDTEIRHRRKFKTMKGLAESKLTPSTDNKTRVKVRELLCRLNNHMDDYNSIFDRFTWSYHSSLKKLKKDILQTTTGVNPSPVPTPEARSDRTTPTEVRGIKIDELAMENLLLHRKGIRDQAFNAVGIIGAEGVGKTSLAQSMLKKKEVVEMFRPRIWVSMADDPVKQGRKLQIAIANRILLALGISDETIDEIRQSVNEDQFLSELIHAIRLELTGKKYLIVLDDASMKEEWYRDVRSDPTPDCRLDQKLGFAFPKGSGGTVLVIGWPENVVKAMLNGDDSAIHRLLPLEDPTLCWDICKREGGDTVEQKVKTEVVKRSGGLPGAARLMGEIVKKRNDEQPLVQPQSNAPAARTT